MKKLFFAVVVSSFMVSNAFAINHSHREELAKSGCTQVQEANGQCNTTANPAAPQKDKVIVKHYNGMKIEWRQNEGVKVDDKPASLVESGSYGATWQQGIYKIITYKNLKIAVMENDVFKGYAK
ncbi:hypothetical protein [Enterobacter sp. R1(2018)]|uniref:hypothetical protein n=1 Tax=Enterobacter sp. R1(2018) TaxID=2447891 RepID=UPI000EAC8B0F|nr:hypothetical protein [Enterobacter sp. R1(2018)]RKQ40324.1 hypothetical protein D8M09_07145 [Enterobacter sp. R1(2018)]